MPSKTILVLVITAAFVAGTLTTGTFASAQTAQSNVPDWVKNNAVWWADGSISENDFLKGMQWLINEEIIQVATAEQVVSQTEFQSMVNRLNGLEQSQNEIADMIKQNAGASEVQIAALQAELENRISLLEAKVSGEIAADCTVHGPEVDLHGCDLSNADLSLSNLRGTDLIGTDLIGTDLIGTDLIGTDLIGTDLIGTDLNSADLIAADFTNCVGTPIGTPAAGSLPTCS